MTINHKIILGENRMKMFDKVGACGWNSVNEFSFRHAQFEGL